MVRNMQIHKNSAIMIQGLVKWPRLFAVIYIPDHRETILSQLIGCGCLCFLLLQAVVMLITILR